MVIRENTNSTLKYHRATFPGKDHFTTVAPAVVEGMVLLKNEHMLSLENIERMARHHPGTLAKKIEEFQEANLKNFYLFLPPVSV